MKLKGNLLTPEEGMYLTQTAEVGDNNRVFATELMLGKADSEENWREAGLDEKEAFDARMSAAEAHDEASDETAPGEPSTDVQQQTTD